MSYQSGRHFLQIPGPTNVPDRVLRALSAPTIDHRGPEFSKLALEVLHGVKRVFQTAGVSVAFILVNAMAALSTNLASMGTLPAALPIWGVAAVVGGVVGTELGTRRLKGHTMRSILAAILALSGLKLIVP